MIWTDDPVRDAETYMIEQEKKLAKMPVCSLCGEHIQEDTALYLWGEWICEGCIDINMRWVEEEEW